MSNEQFYLRGNVASQPLYQRWYAWAHLLYPPTAALNITDRLLKILKSYIKAPHVHAAALRNPAMLGGPFVDLPEEKIPEIEQLCRETEQLEDLMQLAAAIKELSSVLDQEAKGASLEHLYAKVPAPLRGYVELVYDLTSHAGIRFIEPLFYQSHFNVESLQKVVLSDTVDGQQPHVLSTPILPHPGMLEIHMPFRHPGFDSLFSMRTSPQSLAALSEAMEWKDEERQIFRPLFTTYPPRPFDKFSGDGVRVRYMGHATVLIESACVSILVDPFLAYDHDCDVPKYTFTDLPQTIDFILITHAHPDHLHLETLLQLRHKTEAVLVPKASGGNLQDPSIKAILESAGFNCVSELGEFEEREVPSGRIVGIPFVGEHAELDIRSKLTFLVEICGRTLMFAADTRNSEPQIYDNVQRLYGDLDVLFIGMECEGAPLSWLYGPLLLDRLDRQADNSRRLSASDFDMVMSLIETFNCPEVYIYAMGQEPWLKYLCASEYTPESKPIALSNRVISDWRSRGLKAERLFGRKELFFDK